MKIRTPFWLSLSIVLCIAVFLATWVAGETTRRLDSEYLLETVRQDMQRTTSLLAGLITEPVILGEAQKTEAIIRKYASSWNDFTFIHVMDDEGFHFGEWQKRPIKFGPGIRKFEQEITHGEQSFGILSVYVDLSARHAAVEAHVSKSRRQSAATVLSITMLLLFSINFLTLRNENKSVESDPQ